MNRTPNGRCISFVGYKQTKKKELNREVYPKIKLQETNKIEKKIVSRVDKAVDDQTVINDNSLYRKFLLENGGIRQ